MPLARRAAREKDFPLKIDVLNYSPAGYQVPRAWSAFLAHINGQALQAKQKARVLMMQKTKTPDSITSLTEESKRLGAPLSQSGVQPAQTSQAWNDTFAA